MRSPAPVHSPPLAHAHGHGNMGRPPAPIGVVGGETIYKDDYRCAVCVGKALSQARRAKNDTPIEHIRDGQWGYLREQQ